MSGIGFWELIILFLIGLIVLGPERLPRVANQLGTWLGQARRMTRVMRRQLEEEIDIEKELHIKPDSDKSKPSYSKPEYVSQNERDDTYSPAHDKDSAGTGVGTGVGDTRVFGEDDDTDQMPIIDDDKHDDTDVLPNVDPHTETDVMPTSVARKALNETEADDEVSADPAKEKTA